MAVSLDDVHSQLTQLNSKLDDLVTNFKIGPTQIHIVEGLADISENLGLIAAGEFRAPANRNIPGQGFSGVRIVGEGVHYPDTSTADSDLYNIVGIDNDTLQFGLRSSDGAAVFGGGVALLDEDGVQILDTDDLPVFVALSKDATINTESLGAGDVMIGDNSDSSPNMLWDNSQGRFFSRSGVIEAGEIAGGTFQSYGVSVLGAGASNTTNEVPSGSTGTVITFNHPDTDERYDDAGFFDTDQRDRITIPAGLSGRYLITAGTAWDEVSTAGIREFFMEINGAAPFSPLAVDDWPGDTSNGIRQFEIHERELSSGDVIKMLARQNSGSPITVSFPFLQFRKTR